MALCPEIDVASQGNTINSAKSNLQEAVELCFETASREEVKHRLHEELYITQLEVAYA